jgi:hypothetical protein
MIQEARDITQEAMQVDTDEAMQVDTDEDIRSNSNN